MFSGSVGFWAGSYGAISPYPAPIPGRLAGRVMEGSLVVVFKLMEQDVGVRDGVDTRARAREIAALDRSDTQGGEGRAKPAFPVNGLGVSQGHRDGPNPIRPRPQARRARATRTEQAEGEQGQRARG